MRLPTYIQTAMNRGEYEILDDQTFYGHIPGFDGVWANEPTLEKCRQELREALEDWILLGMSMKHELPTVNGVELK